MKLFRFLRRLYWKAVLCEAEERAELSCRRRGDFASNLRWVKRLDRYEETFGPFKALDDQPTPQDR